MTHPPALLVGFSRVDITTWEAGRVMMGWADPRNVARDAAEPLYARAMALHDEARDERVVFVCVELGIVTDKLRDAVIERVQKRTTLPAHALMLAATHNHSGPGGIAGYFWYDIPSGGFSPRIFGMIADGIAEACIAALAAMTPAELRWSRGRTGLREVATNRAWRAYNRNVDVAPVTRQTAELAVDDEMQVLRVDSLDGRPLGMVNWIGLHGTCFHGDGNVIRPDHKGIAAARFEADQSTDFVAIFAQGPAGDVTSNRRFDRRRGVTVGPGEDDAASASVVAALEVAAARELFDRAASAPAEAGPIAVESRREVLGERDVPPKFVDGNVGCRTTRPIIALGMALGTDEGPGPLHVVRRAQRALSSITRLGFRALERVRGRHLGNVQIPMVVFDSDVHARAFGVIPAEHRWIPMGFVPPLADTLRRIRHGATQGGRWLPGTVDVQIVRLGSTAIAGIGAEPTTVAGRRLRASIADQLRTIGVRDVVISTYTNGYTGYLVTPEEHLEQGYESGGTVFGRWSLPMWQALFDDVARDLGSALPS